MSREITAAITCIGSGIGQSIINSLRRSSLQVHTVGFGNAPFEYGALDCDQHQYVPSIYDPAYTDVLLEKCGNHGVDIVIPGLDDDVLILSENEPKFAEAGIKVLASGNELVSLCRNKEKMSNAFSAISEHFIRSFNTENVEAALQAGEISFPCLAKPRGGSGSMGVELVKHREELERLPEDYILQELLIPREDDVYYQQFLEELEKGRAPQLSELSVQVVTGFQGEFLGRMATVNKLKNGVPIEIFPIHRQEIWEAVEEILPRLRALGLRGSVNIQGRITDQGIRFFEVNPRFTGITGLRALFGFNEVEACLKSWMGIPSDDPPFDGQTEKFGLRQVADKAVPIYSHQKAQAYDAHLHGAAPGRKRVLLITGSTGYLGRNLLSALDPGQYELWVLSTDEGKARKLFRDKVDRYYGVDVFQSGSLPWGGVDVLLHAGFARPYRTPEAIADSLSFTERLFRYAGMNGVPALINISSQSVYGQASPPPWKEDAPVAPESPYAAAKYASECMLRSQKKAHPHLNVTSLRLAGLAGGQSGLVPVDLVARFVQQALNGEAIEIRGQHTFERLDVRDAVDGVINFLSVPASQWKEVYNLGKGEAFSIETLAREVVDQVHQVKGVEPSPIIVKDEDKSLHFGMDSSLFYQATGWRPKYTLGDTIRSLIDYFEDEE